MTYEATDDDPITPPVDLSEQFGDETRDEIKRAFNERVDEERRNGLSAKVVGRFREILKNDVNVFGIKLGTSSPANIVP